MWGCAAALLCDVSVVRIPRPFTHLPLPRTLLLQHVTFVSGTNGSGKSAVLQALQCCLGVKASNTGRANSFKKVRVDPLDGSRACSDRRTVSLPTTPAASAFLSVPSTAHS